MAKYTSADIQKIVERLKDARERQRPAHFLIGAGCSVTAGIPSANELIGKIHKRYKAHCADLKDEERRSYGACMALLAPNERRDLITPYLEKARINWGTIALAQLIVNGYIGRVLTVNFDLVLENACGLLGLQPAVYDFGVAPASDPAMVVTPSIIHLHGQSYGLVLLNSKEETRRHRKKLQPILRDSLRNAPLVIVGYSGSADGIFQTLLEEFKGREYLYWLGYEEEPKAHVGPFLEKNHFQFMGSADFDRFMLELANALACWPPNLFKDPLGHLLETLRPVVPYPEKDSASAFDLLSGLRQDLEKWKTDLNKGDHSNELRELYMKNEFEKAINYFLSLPKDKNAAEGDRDIAASSMLRLGNLKFRQLRASSGKKAARLVKEVEKHYETALQLKPDMTDTLVNLGNLRLSQASRAVGDQAAHFFGEGVKKYQAALSIDRKYGPALYNWASALIDHSKRVHSKQERGRLLAEADKKLSAALKINPLKTYNSACLVALRGEEEKCRQNLEIALQNGTSPNVEFMSADPDLDSVKEKPWFKAILAKQKKPTARSRRRQPPK